MKINRIQKSVLAAAMAAVALLSSATRAKANTLLLELEHAIAEVSCFESEINTVASLTVTPRDGSDMLSGAATFSNFGWRQKYVERDFEADAPPILSATYGRNIGEITVETALFEDVSGRISSFGDVSVSCSKLSLN